MTSSEIITNVDIKRKLELSCDVPPGTCSPLLTCDGQNPDGMRTWTSIRARPACSEQSRVPRETGIRTGVLGRPAGSDPLSGSPSQAYLCTSASHDSDRTVDARRRLEVPGMDFKASHHLSELGFWHGGRNLLPQQHT